MKYIEQALNELPVTRVPEIPKVSLSPRLEFHLQALQLLYQHNRGYGCPGIAEHPRVLCLSFLGRGYFQQLPISVKV